MRFKDQLQKMHEWAQIIVTKEAHLEPLAFMCAAPFCSNTPCSVYYNGKNYYFLCDDCRQIVQFEQRWLHERTKYE